MNPNARHVIDAAELAVRKMGKHFALETAEGLRIAEVRYVGRPDGSTSEGDAVRLALCWNNHDALVAALVRVTDHLHELAKDERDDHSTGIFGWDDTNDAVAQARAALAKVSL